MSNGETRRNEIAYASGLSDFEGIQSPSTDPELLGDLDPANDSGTDVGSTTANDDGAFAAEVTLDSSMFAIGDVKSLVATDAAAP